MRSAMATGALVISDCVLAEITPAFRDQAELIEFLQDWHLSFMPSAREAAILAGAMFKRYLERRGLTGRRVVADFLIGAHAMGARRPFASERSRLLPRLLRRPRPPRAVVVCALGDVPSRHDDRRRCWGLLGPNHAGVEVEITPA